MSTTFSNPGDLHDPTAFGYSHTASAPLDSELVSIAGQYGSDPTGQTASSDFGQQVEQSLANLGTALRAVGLDYEDVLRIGTYIVDHNPEKLEILLAAIRRIWGDKPPTQTLIGVAALALPDMLFEIDALAVRPVAGRSR